MKHMDMVKNEILVTNGYSKNNYGRWLNIIMENSPSEWVLIQDHDIFFCQKDWFQRCLDAIELVPNAGLFTCTTNRIGNGQQKVSNLAQNCDLRAHWEFGEGLGDIELIEATRPISGLMMLTSKIAWKASGGFRERGIIGVDNHYYGAIKRAGYPVYIIKNLYVFHRYRL